MIKFIWKYLFGNEYNTPKLSVEDIVTLRNEDIITFQEARYNLGFSWYEKGTDIVFDNIKEVKNSQRGIAI